MSNNTSLKKLALNASARSFVPTFGQKKSVAEVKSKDTEVPKSWEDLDVAPQTTSLVSSFSALSLNSSSASSISSTCSTVVNQQASSSATSSTTFIHASSPSPLPSPSPSPSPTLSSPTSTSISSSTSASTTSAIARPKVPIILDFSKPKAKEESPKEKETKTDSKEAQKPAVKTTEAVKKDDKTKIEKSEKIDKKEEKKVDKVESKKDEKKHDDREHVNLVCIGHVDSGKSTISGQILLLTGQVDERTIAKYEKEAKEKNRESWYIAYIMDTNEEERAKGKTVEVGRAHFTTNSKRYTLLDAPGHKMYVPNMIGGASQADIGLLVISARRGEFETGFEKGGQTREHAMLAKTLGISRLIVLVNKMDDSTVAWSKARYDDIKLKLMPFLKKWGYNCKTDVWFIPVSGQTGQNLKDPVPKSVCEWIEPRQSLFQLLDAMKPIERDTVSPVRIPVMTRFKDLGAVYLVGKMETGILHKGDKLTLLPNNVDIDVVSILIDEDEVSCAYAGENVVLRTKGVDEEEVHTGYVLCSPGKLAKSSIHFEAQIAVLDLIDSHPILTAGYNCVLHVHTAAVECQISKLVAEYDKATMQPSKKRPRFLSTGTFANVRIEMEDSVVVEVFKEFPSLGRFTLRDEGQTIAIGKILRLLDEKEEKKVSKEHEERKAGAAGDALVGR
eukprot:TRINITY_DN4274_c0_g1_i1.p1 TRINITY_DN4274_c0_g1~~TRINITY_DN4274_c0_g1_i1.p1  ORF type:complete len:673 (-),score=184.30 TRINITY_DN4274_c0_g1_i1:1117-3135(-)